ncbi:MAG: serine hydrolase [Lewinellaceae bacterium]|nr:serine hydrolase [Lewinellaceae bacterium]
MRLFIFLFSILTCIAGTLPAQPGPVFPQKSWTTVSPQEAGYAPGALQEIDNYLRDSCQTTGLVVIVGGKMLYSYGNTRELSYLASVRKSILAMLYGNYISSGLIDLSLTLADLGIDDIGGLSDLEKQATLEHLITARSGVYHPASNGGDNSADAPPRNSQAPGTYLLYNNWDFNAAGAIFEQLTQQTIYQALEHDLAIPLHMQDFAIKKQRKGGNLKVSRFPAYHIWLSTRDMARIGYLMLRGGNWNGQQLVPADWAKKISSVVTPLEEMNPGSMRQGEFGYGYMWWIWDGPTATGPFAGAYSARGAYGQYITVLPALDMVIAHKTNPKKGRSTSWKQYMGVVKRLIATRNE